MGNEKNDLYIYSLLFLVLAVISVVDLIVSLVGGDLAVAKIIELTGTTEEIARVSVIIGVSIGVLSILFLLYLGIMGIRQVKGLRTGSLHIVLATIGVVFLAIALITEMYNIFTSPNKNWIGLLSSLGSVLIGILYIRAAKTLKKEEKLENTVQGE